MKLHTLLYTLVLGLVFGSFSSCEKDLNALPSQAVVDETVVVDQNSAQIALNGAYYRLANTGLNLSVQSTRWSNVNEVIPAMMAGWMSYGFGATTTDTHDYTPASTGDWSYAYFILNAANGTIAGVEAVADSKFTGNRKTEILAEARFLRAYAHFHLLSYFGEWFDLNSIHGVLLRDKPLIFGNGNNQPRSTVKDSYAYILQDIDYAITHAKENNPAHYVNKAAAQALKIRVLMSRGQQSDYTALITLADEIIANPNYALETSLKDLFQSKGLTSKEVILGITPYPTQRSRNATYEYIQSSVYIASPAFKTLLANDPRASWMLTPSTHPTVLIYNTDPQYLTKYKGTHYEDAYVFRLTEVHLLKAEAIVRSGGSLNTAKTILKNIMGHAGVTDFSAVDNATTTDQVLYQIYLEFSRNFVSENGVDWFALLRLPYETVKTLRPTITTKTKYIFPIPATEFQTNPSIGDQNPGYPKE
ncbi:RagB/SusD family nutrient uptake outer membrane protein [Sphingobacterium olei]|nr:RagB/SusD family nutrient uptake outer membrane protein [Sphingobacterium olei]